MNFPALGSLAQSVLISAMVNGEHRINVAQRLFELGLQYRRARTVAHEISGCGIAVVNWGIKGYLVELDEPLIAWCVALPHFRTPVGQIVRTSHRANLPEYVRLAGTTALACIVGSTPPATRRLAIFSEDADGYFDCSSPPSLTVDRLDEVELWSTPPAAIAHGICHVDPLSLFLCLRGLSERPNLAELRRVIGELLQVHRAASL